MADEAELRVSFSDDEGNEYELYLDYYELQEFLIWAEQVGLDDFDVESV